MTRRPLEISSLSPAERVVAAAAWLGVANGVIPWWFRVETSTGTSLHNAGLTVAGTIAFGSFAAAGIGVLIRAWVWPKPSKGWDARFYLLAGLTALVSAATLLATHDATWFGLYAADLCAFALIAGGARRLRERRRGWS